MLGWGREPDRAEHKVSATLPLPAQDRGRQQPPPSKSHNQDHQNTGTDSYMACGNTIIVAVQYFARTNGLCWSINAMGKGRKKQAGS